MLITDGHHQAMELADQADRLKRSGQLDEANRLLAQAFELEKEAALKFIDKLTVEPTRSVLFRSAASLALECGQVRDAERMISMGLYGTPPDEIAEELRDLLERVHFDRHLATRGVVLSPDEFQLSMWGAGVGLGMIETHEVVDRIGEVVSMATRTLERKMNKPFRKAGKPPREISQHLGLYMSIPRAASYAVTIRVGTPQTEIPGTGLSQEVVTEVMDCLDLLVTNRKEELRQRIHDTDYFENFVHITKMLSPDGKRVQHVGFTALRTGVERRVVLDEPRTAIVVPERVETQEPSEAAVQVLTGNLRFADSTKRRQGVIELVDSTDHVHKIHVPLSMMADIVRPMFEYDVVVRARREGKVLLLEDIQKSDE